MEKEEFLEEDMDEEIVDSNQRETCKEFFKELDILVQNKYKELINLVVDSGITSFNYIVELDNNNISKFNLNKDIEFEVSATPGEGKINYLYKRIKIEPKNYWSRPIPYYEVSTLQLLQECIKQDTYNPDIKYLERGETEFIKTESKRYGSKDL